MANIGSRYRQIRRDEFVCFPYRIYLYAYSYGDMSSSGDTCVSRGRDVYVSRAWPKSDMDRDMDGASTGADKWGEQAIAAGFTLLPNHFLALNQFLPDDRRLSPTEMLVLLQILSAWWSKDKLPFPSKATIAQRAGLSPRQVQRALTALEQSGFVKRVSRYNRNQGRTSNQFDLTGLVAAVVGAAESNPTAFKRQISSNEQDNDKE